MLDRHAQLGVVIGYTNASWTLKVDLVSRYVTGHAPYMRESRLARGSPPGFRRGGLPTSPFIEMSSGYFERRPGTACPGRATGRRGGWTSTTSMTRRCSAGPSTPRGWSSARPRARSRPWPAAPATGHAATPGHCGPGCAAAVAPPGSGPELGELALPWPRAPPRPLLPSPPAAAQQRDAQQEEDDSAEAHPVPRLPLAGCRARGLLDGGTVGLKVDVAALRDLGQGGLLGRAVSSPRTARCSAAAAYGATVQSGATAITPLMAALLAAMVARIEMPFAPPPAARSPGRSAGGIVAGFV